MANPLWVEGAISPNPSGRPKSNRSVRTMVMNFVKKRMTPNRLGVLYDKLSPVQQAEMLLQLLPFAIARQAPDSISREEVDELYKQLEAALKGKHAAQAKVI